MDRPPDMVTRPPADLIRGVQNDVIKRMITVENSGDFRIYARDPDVRYPSVEAAIAAGREWLLLDREPFNQRPAGGETGGNP